MLLPSATQYQKRSGRIKITAQKPTPPVVGPILLAATYDREELIITLTFDRAIDTSEYDGTQVVLNDPVNGQQYTATASQEFITDDILQISLDSIGGVPGPSVTLNAGAGNGITSLADGTMWAGVSELGLPFP